MNKFASLSAADRSAILQETAARMGIGSPAIIEKDFWVCWTLGQIFTSPSLPGPLFKGGTSLSKVYGIIARFSEDIDIVLDRHALGFAGEDDPINIGGTNRRKRRLQELAATCSHTVQSSVRQILQERFTHELGAEGWSVEPDVANPDGQSLLFAYPVGLEARLYGAIGYIRPVVRLEFGCRGDVWPAEEREIRPYVAETFPALFTSPDCPVRVLRPDRTFWEKVTLLHALTHSGKTPPRFSRHYYDVSRLYRHEVGSRAITDLKLLEQVVKHKTVFFREAAARYDLAKPGSLCISPDPGLERELRRDYRKMQEMFFEEAPLFDQILADIRELEARVNSAR
jgi:predicted nucleotidyltransferase component of viral defense system